MDKPMTARDYRAHADKVNSKRPTEIVTLKSGSVFELRKPDLQGYVLTGRLPQSLLAEGMKAWRAQGKVPGSATSPVMGGDDTLNSLVFMREVVHDCCVNPRFVEFATQDNEISASDMLPEDFTEIFSWAMGHQGVTGAAGLEEFREGRKRGTAGNRTRGKKQRSENINTVGSTASVS